MTPNNNEKPEWFQLTEGDKAPRQRSIKRGVRVLALTLPLLALGTGFVVAQSHGGPGASANASVSSASSQRTPTQALLSAENSPASVSSSSQEAVAVNADQKISSAAPSKSESKAITPKKVTTPATVTTTPSATPSIIAPPTGGESEEGSEGSSAITPNVGSGSISQLPTTRGEGDDGLEANDD